MTRTTVAFAQSFQLPGFNETLPPGEYEIETRIDRPITETGADLSGASVMIRLHPRDRHPGLARTLTVSLADYRTAVSRDHLQGKPLRDFQLEEMLADPLIRLVMRADGVTETDLRDGYADRPGLADPDDRRRQWRQSWAQGDRVTGPKPGSPRPGIGE